MRPLLLDHLRWLLYEWMQPAYGAGDGIADGRGGGAGGEDVSSPVSQGSASQTIHHLTGGRGGGGEGGGFSQSRSSSAPLLDLSVFPYQLLCPQGATLADFMRMYGSILLPLICQGTHPYTNISSSYTTILSLLIIIQLYLFSIY